MRNRAELIQAALKYMERLIGMDYSRTHRYKWYKGGSTDCSGYVYAAWLAAGWPLLVDGVEKMTSMYEVYADGFDLVYPDIYENIGKRFAKISDIPFEPGDIIFYSFGTTTRANKITHVAVCYDKTHIIHTANNRNKACVQDISYGDGSVVAVIRPKDGAAETKRPIIQKGTAGRIATRRMQALLNQAGAALNCDGIWGTKTDEALKTYQIKMGLAASGICDGDTWAALCGEAGEDAEKTMGTIKRNLKRGHIGGDVMHLQHLVGTKADGVFGLGTRSAVRTAQRRLGLSVDGIAGRDTVTALGGDWKPDDVLVVGTFNVKRGKSSSSVCRKLAAAMAGCDIVGLQEVTAGYLPTMAGELNYKQCKTVGSYGHAIISSPEPEGERIYKLPAGGEARKLHRLVFDVGGKEIHFYNVHIQYTSTKRPTINLTQMTEVLSIMQADTAPVQILTGDFNCGLEAFDMFKAAGFTVLNHGQNLPALHGGMDAAYPMDNIIVRGCQPMNAWVYPAIKRGYSDHDGFFAEVRI